MNVPSKETRKDKLKLLKDLQSGLVSLTELKPRIPISERNVWIGDSKSVENLKTGEILTTEEFERRFPDRSNWINIK
jgi:hypothetical protein